MDELNKKIDESWKETVEKEKQKAEKEGGFPVPVADFSFFVSTLALQVSIALGLVTNPATNEKQEDMAQAKFIIDTLGMLQEKTKGNLTKEETELIENILYELRMQYVNKSQGGEKK